MNSEDRKTLLSFGYNSMGQASTKLADAFLFPKVIDPQLFNHERVRLIKTGLEASYFFIENNRLYVSGCNLNHELGIPWISLSTIQDSERIVLDYEVSEDTL